MPGFRHTPHWISIAAAAVSNTVQEKVSKGLIIDSVRKVYAISVYRLRNPIAIGFYMQLVYTDGIIIILPSSKE